MKVNVQTELRESAIATFESMAFLFVMPESETEQMESEPSHTVSVDFQGPFTGRLAVTVPTPMMQMIATNMLGEEDAPSEWQQQDALGEIANVICGNILPKIGGYRQVFNISAPEFMDNCAAKLQHSDQDAHVSIVLDEGRADVDLYICGELPN